MEKIRIALVGVGNCASSLVQGIHFYKNSSPGDCPGLMHWDIGGLRPSDIDVVCAWDVDKRKVGKDLSEAIFCLPNCTAKFFEDVPRFGWKVQMGCVLDGISEHMKYYEAEYSFVLAEEPEAAKADIVRALKETGTEILMIYLPVGSEQATRFYAECALEAGVGLINCIPVFMASDPEFEGRFKTKGLPIIGDDVKSQLGATILHRVLVDLFKKRGVKLERTYQLNIGGNTDFLNMLDRNRLSSKRRSKTEAVQTVAGKRLAPDDIHIGPSDYVRWQKDKKVCFIRMEGRGFGDLPVELEARLSAEDSANSAGVTIDAIRCCKMAIGRGQGGALYGPSAYFMKHPPRQYPDDQAYFMTESFIQGLDCTDPPSNE